MIAVITAVSGDAWPGAGRPDPHGLRDAIEIMQAMRRRIDADDATSDDQRRYRIASGTAERLARALADRNGWPSIAVDAGVLRAALGASGVVWSPDEAEAVTRDWQRRFTAANERAFTDFLSEARKKRAGLVISIQPVATGAVIELSESTETNTERSECGAGRPDLIADAVEALHQRSQVPFTDEQGKAAERRQRQAQALRGQVVDALRRGDVVPIGMAAPHDVIVEVLRELQDPHLPAGRLRIVHVDSSEGAAFPVGARPHRSPAVADRRSARLGLMSVRHMVADASVAGYWFRNRLVSVSDRTLAETEAFCYRDTLARLPDLIAGGINHIEMLHNGFEPAAIGFYRAVLAYNNQRDWHEQLLVTPRYLHGGEVTGTPWLAALGATTDLLRRGNQDAAVQR
jgi:hypothetical protein